MEDDPHTLIYKARAAMSGLMKMVSEFDKGQVEITGWEMTCLLELIDEKLKLAEEQLEGQGS